MSDDLLDVEGHSAVTGKPRGIDLRDGNPSLPIVLALRHDPELARLFARRQPSPADVEAGLRSIRGTGVLAAVSERARGHVAAAVAEIGRLPPSACRTTLEALASDLVDRGS
jgi:geranylgeranyl pyrophosphate synthase